MNWIYAKDKLPPFNQEVLIVSRYGSDPTSVEVSLGQRIGGDFDEPCDGLMCLDSGWTVPTRDVVCWMEIIIPGEVTT